MLNKRINFVCFNIIDISTVQKILIGFIRIKIKLYARISLPLASRYALKLFLSPVRNLPKKIPSIFKRSEKIELRLSPYRLKGYRWNHPQPKKALILHGFSSTIHKFDHFVKPLIKQGYEVIAIDAPAHGKSSGKQISVLEYKAMIEHIHATLGPIDAFIAHSFGGLALALALEKITEQEKMKVVLIAPATETITAIQIFSKFLRLPQAVKAGMEELIFERSGIRPEDFSIRKAAPHIKAQVLWIHDESDEITPWKDAVVIKDAGYPNFQFLLTQTFGHRRIYRENKVTKAVFEFLS